MPPVVSYFIILLCLMPDNFTRLGERAAQFVMWNVQWYSVYSFFQSLSHSKLLNFEWSMHDACENGWPLTPFNPLSFDAPQCALLIFFYLSNARWVYLSMGKLCSLMGLKFDDISEFQNSIAIENWVTVFTCLSAAALFKFSELQMQRSFRGGGQSGGGGGRPLKNIFFVN